MKQVTATLLFLGLSAFCAIGQNVTVIMKDGSAHKYNADYLNEISFKDVDPETPPVELKTIQIEAYSGGNVMTTFADEGAKNQLKLDLYGPKDAVWMQTGTYTYATTSAPFTVNPRYSKVTVNGTDVKFTDATIEVTQDGDIYTFDIVLVLEDGSKFHGKYVGELPSYTQLVNETLTHAKYNENPQPAGDFYVQINNNYSATPYYEGAIIFTADAAATTLPAGEYTLSETRAAGTFSTRSYLEQSYPAASIKFSEGSKITVTKDGDNYTMVMDLKFVDGRTGNFTYNGAITGTPSFEIPTVELKTVELEAYSGGNVMTTFADEGKNNQLQLDLYGPKDAVWMQTGTYTYATTSAPYTVNPRYSKVTINGTAVKFTDATIEVSQEGRNYTFDISLALEDGSQFKGKYVGELPTYNKWVNETLTHAKYNVNPQPAGDFYVQINNAYSATPYYEGAIIFTADASATTLPAGEYTLSETRAAGTFSTRSYLEQSYPTASIKFSEGSKITVTKDGDNYTMTMDLKFVDGRTGNFTFTGAITGTPTFE